MPARVDRSTYAVVVALHRTVALYGASTNVTRLKRGVVITDGSSDVPRRSTLILWDAHASASADWRVGDVIYVSRLRSSVKNRHDVDGRTFTVVREGTVRVVARAEEMEGRARARAARNEAPETRVAITAGEDFGNGMTKRQALGRAFGVARTVEREVVRAAAEAADARRRESFGAGATYAEAERLGERRVAHFFGRVVREEIRTSSWTPSGGTTGEAYARRVVWVCQTKGGHVVEVHLPPTKASTEWERASTRGEVIDVRNALVRSLRGKCDLVCDPRFSYWRVMDTFDPRRAEVLARVPESSFSRDMSFSTLACAMRGETSFGDASALIKFSACVKWVRVKTSASARRRVPPMIAETDVARVIAGMTYLACDSCLRELKADVNGVHKSCACSSHNDGTRCVFAWRELSLGLQGGDDEGVSDSVIPVRAVGECAKKLLLNMDAETVLKGLDDNRDDDEDSAEDTSTDGSSPHLATVVGCVVNALAARKRNSAVTWTVRFPCTDLNGVPKREELELVEFQI